MAITISPLYPVVGEAVTFTSSTAIGTHQVIQLDSLPSTSAMSTGFVLLPAVDLPSSALVAVEQQSNADSAVFDEPGEYRVVLYDIREIANPPATESDRGGEHRYQYVAIDAGMVHVGAIVELPVLTVDGQGATLRLQVNDTTVRAASLVDHTDDNARALAEMAAPVAALAALVGQTAATMGNDLITGANNLRVAYEGHRVTLGGVHAAADATNTVNRQDVDTEEAAIELVNRLREVMLRHLFDMPVAGAWHTEEDRRNVPLAPTAHDLAGATLLLADLRERVYAPHRVQIANPATHGVADPGNDITAATALDGLVVAYFDALVTPSPPVLAGEPEGAHDAAANFGFSIVDE